ncbi:MAG: hypothetical protein V3T86_01400 [Planctomycetota bacterium]
MAKKRGPKSSNIEVLPEVELLADEEHPDFVAGAVCDDSEECAEAQADESIQEAANDLSAELAGAHIFPRRFPRPFPRWPRFCSAVSGRYRFAPRFFPPAPPSGPFVPRPISPLPAPFLPITIKVRVDVDRFFPQDRISIEVRRRFPNSTAHAIAEVTSDRCIGLNRRRIEAAITYRDGAASLIPGDRVVFEAKRVRGFFYGAYTLRLMQGPSTVRTWNLVFESRYFDPVEFEVDSVANAGTPVTTYATGSHPNRPANLPSETISLQSVYQRAGFDVAMSPNTTVIPTSDAGANGTWSDSEMHNAMVTYWSRFQNRPQWAMWVLYAARHDIGRSLGGIMFDDIGPNHRQGTAIFTDSFVQDAPNGDADPVAWRRRMVFWTAAHEMGHAFNLAHSWQKSLGNPWITLANEPEARSFMNYPFAVSGGESSFFADFPFRFSDQELIFMRHAPRRFVQMGNSDWFVNHGFEAPESLMQGGGWSLEIRPNREANGYAFMEPVEMELKLTNSSSTRREVDKDLLADGQHVSILIAREGSGTRRWRPFVTHCHRGDPIDLKQGEAIYGAHLVSASTAGWLIDEPGFYKLQAAVDLGDEVVVSNVLRLHVAPPGSDEETELAPNYFSEDVARVLAFEGAPALESATDVLRELQERCPDHPAATHAALALCSPMLRDFKLLDAVPGDRTSLQVRSQTARLSEGAETGVAALLENPGAAAQTLGHINYFNALSSLANAMDTEGDETGAAKVLTSSVATMKLRGVLPSVIKTVERRLAKYR